MSDNQLNPPANNQPSNEKKESIQTKFQFYSFSRFQIFKFSNFQITRFNLSNYLYCFTQQRRSGTLLNQNFSIIAFFEAMTSFWKNEYFILAIATHPVVTALL